MVLTLICGVIPYTEQIPSNCSPRYGNSDRYRPAIKMDKKTEPISVTLLADDKEWIDREAERLDPAMPNRSKIVRRAIQTLRESTEADE